MEKWELNLRNFLDDNGCFRLSYAKWNETLHRWCGEFVHTIRQHNGMKASCTFSPYRGITEINVKMDSYVEFKAVVSFSMSENGDFSLNMKHTTSFDFKKQWSRIIQGKQEESDAYYHWDEEELTEPEICKQGYVIQLLINRFEEFIEWRKSTEGGTFFN